MLKLTLQPGEFIRIGENVKVIFSGGSANNIHLLIDAPREILKQTKKIILLHITRRRGYQTKPKDRLLQLLSGKKKKICKIIRMVMIM